MRELKPPTPEPLELGDIVYGNVTDECGRKTGNHPLVIMTIEEYEQVGFKYYVALVSSQMRHFNPEHKHLRLKHEGRTDPRTKFDRENFAVCDGLYAIWHADIENYKGGQVYDEDFEAIKKLLGPPPHRRKSRRQR